MIQPSRLFCRLCACGLVVVPAPAEAFELNGGVSVGGIQVGTDARLAVSPFASLLWRTERGFLLEAHHMFSIVPGGRVGGATAECTVTWKAGSDYCKEKGTAGSCKTLYQGEHTSLDQAKERCEVAHGAKNGSDVESCGPCHWVTSAATECEDKCHDEYDNKVKECNKVTDKVARAKCQQVAAEQLGDCIQKCKKK